MALLRCDASSALISAKALSFSAPSGRISRPSTVYLAGCVAGRLGVMLDWLPAIVRLIAR